MNYKLIDKQEFLNDFVKSKIQRSNECLKSVWIASRDLERVMNMYVDNKVEEPDNIVRELLPLEIEAVFLKLRSCLKEFEVSIKNQGFRRNNIIDLLNNIESLHNDIIKIGDIISKHSVNIDRHIDNFTGYLNELIANASIVASIIL